MRPSVAVVVLAVVALLAPRTGLGATVVPPGQIFAPQLWTVAGSPYILTGDITVVFGVTLTIQPGVVVQMNPGDANFGGFHTFRTEIRVDGTLVALGTPEEPIVFEGTVPGRNTWTGIRIDFAGGVATLEHILVRDASFGIYSAANAEQLTLNRSRFEECQIALSFCVGTPTMDSLEITSCSAAGQFGCSSAPTLTNALIHHNDFGLQSLNFLSVLNCTIDACGTGVYATASGIASVRNCSITNNSSHGLFAEPGGQVFPEANNVWNSGVADYEGVSPDGASISADPMYEDAVAYRLLPCSPNIEAGADIGSVTADAFGALRPFDADLSGVGQWDIGWHESSDLSLAAAIDSPSAHTIALDGSPAVLTVGASGTEPLAFQWRRDGVALVDDGRITGSATGTLSIDPVQATDLGVYDCVVSNACGSTATNPVALCVSGGAACEGNANGDAIVDFDDLVAVLANWLSVCP